MDVIVCFSFDHLVGLKNWPNLLKFGGFGGGKIGTVDTKIGTVHPNSVKIQIRPGPIFSPR
jgi:hypothetical protein